MEGSTVQLYINITKITFIIMPILTIILGMIERAEIRRNQDLFHRGNANHLQIIRRWIIVFCVSIGVPFLSFLLDFQLHYYVVVIFFIIRNASFALWHMHLMTLYADLHLDIIDVRGKSVLKLWKFVIIESIAFGALDMFRYFADYENTVLYHSFYIALNLFIIYTLGQTIHLNAKAMQGVKQSESLVRLY